MDNRLARELARLTRSHVPLSAFDPDVHKQVVGAFSDLRAELITQVLANVASVALIDRSSLARASDLVRGKLASSPPTGLPLTFGGEIPEESEPSVECAPFRIDPFVALGDLAAVVNAALLYDRVAVIHPDREVVLREFRELGVDDVCVPIDPGLRKSADEPWGHKQAMAEALQMLWEETVSDLSATVDQKPAPQWVSDLNKWWRELLPPLQGDADLSADDSQFSSSPNQPTWAVFENDGGPWRIAPEEHLLGLVRDNSYRAYFYLMVAEFLSAILTVEGAEFRPPVNVRYVGGCLRTPMVLAATRYDPQLEVPLEDVIESTRRASDKHVRTPFWLDAVLARCRGADDLRDAIQHFRRIAKPLRDARTELEEAIYRDDQKEVARLRRAVISALGNFVTEATKAAGDLAIGAAGFALEATGCPGAGLLTKTAEEVIEPAVPFLANSLERLGNKLFRPRLAVVQTFVDAAAHCRNSLGVASRVFKFPKGTAEQPMRFVALLSKIRWCS